MSLSVVHLLVAILCIGVVAKGTPKELTGLHGSVVSAVELKAPSRLFILRDSSGIGRAALQNTGHAWEPANGGSACPCVAPLVLCAPLRLIAPWS